MNVTPRTPIRVVVVNDHEIVTKGFSGLVEPFADWVQAVELIGGVGSDDRVDIALVDPSSERPSEGCDLRTLLEHPHIERVVAYTWNMDQDLILAAARMGVHGYLAKSMPGPDLVDALVRVHRGDRVVSRDAVRPSPWADGGWPGRAEGLTVRESEVVALIAQGFSNEEIAQSSHLSINSVKSYIRSAYRKMGVTRRSQAVLWGVRHGFLPDRGRRLESPPGPPA